MKEITSYYCKTWI